MNKKNINVTLPLEKFEKLERVHNEVTYFVNILDQSLSNYSHVQDINEVIAKNILHEIVITVYEPLKHILNETKQD